MQFTADSIASILNGTVEGDGSVLLDSFAKIEEGHPGALSFLANPKYTHYIYTTKSSAVLVSRDFEPQQHVPATMIRVADPYESLAQLLRIANEAMNPLPVGIEQPSFVAEGVDIPADCYVGAFAYIGKGASIAKGAKIFPQCFVGEGCSIGEGTILYPGVKVYKGCKIGSNCILHAGAVIGADGFGFAPEPNGEYSKIPQLGIVEISDNVEIGANTTIDRAVMGATRIGRGVKLDNLIQIAHNVEVGANTAMAAQVGIAGSSKIGSQCIIAGQVGIVGHLTVGDNVQIGAQAGVNKSLKADGRYMGTPAVPFGEYARTLSFERRLSSLFDDVEALKGNKKTN